MSTSGLTGLFLLLWFGSAVIGLVVGMVVSWAVEKVKKVVGRG